MVIELILIFYMVNCVVGVIVFFMLIGMLIFLYRKRKWVRFLYYFDVLDVIKKKLLRIWDIIDVLYLFIYIKVWLSFLNILYELFVFIGI